MAGVQRRLCDERLNTRRFRNLNDAREAPASWGSEYNLERPRSLLDYRTPREFRQHHFDEEAESRRLLSGEMPLPSVHSDLATNCLAHQRSG
ncbi:MAG: integrase core domain-containing protein [Acidobacteriota bacterium]